MDMITRCQLMNPSRMENTDPDAERLAEFAKLTKGNKLNIIKHLMRNAGNLANTLQDFRPDIANALDAMRNGDTMSLKKMENRILSAVMLGNIVQLDTATGKITATDIKTLNKIEYITPIIFRITRDKEVLITQLK